MKLRDKNLLGLPDGIEVRSSWPVSRQVENDPEDLGDILGLPDWITGLSPGLAETAAPSFGDKMVTPEPEDELGDLIGISD